MQAGRSRGQVTMNSLNIFFNLPNPSKPHHGPGVYSAFNRNEYRKIFLRVMR
jgi:hypothetical protein